MSGPAMARAGSTAARYGNDFTVFYAAAAHLVAYGDPYNHAIAVHTPYLYPPLFALLLAPLALLPLPIAAGVWYWLNILFSALLIYLAVDLIDTDKRLAAALILLIMVARLIFDNLLWGQVNILVALLVCAWFWALRRGWQWRGAALLAIAISIKITPALFGVYLLVKRKWRQLAQLTVCLLALNLLSLAPLGERSGELLEGWFRRAIMNGQGFNWAYAGNQSLRGALARALAPARTEASFYPQANLLTLSARAATLTFAIAAIALLVIFALMLTRASERPGDRQWPAATGREWQRLLAEFSCCSCLTLLLSNLSWKPHFILIAPAWALLVGIALSRHARRRLAALTLIVNLLLCTATAEPLIGARAHQWFEVYSAFCTAALLSFAATLMILSNRFEMPARA